MSIPALGSAPTIAAPVSLPRDNEAVEKVPDNEAFEGSQARLSLKEGIGTKIDVTV